MYSSKHMIHLAYALLAVDAQDDADTHFLQEASKALIFGANRVEELEGKIEQMKRENRESGDVSGWVPGGE